MRAPGMRLRAVASRICRAETLERLIDPVVADLQRECTNAANEGLWRRGAIRSRGYFAFWAAVGSHAGLVLGAGVRKAAAADDWAVGRFLGVSAIIATVVTALMVLVVPLAMAGSVARLRTAFGGNVGRALPFLIPQALPIAVPAALLCGILWSVGGRSTVTLVRRTILLLAVLGSVFSFVMLESVIPNANQAYRVAIFQKPGDSRLLAKGANELTWSELSERLITLKPFGSFLETRLLRLAYHGRIAFSLTPLMFGLLGLQMAGRIRKHPIVIGLAATTLFCSYFALYPFYRLVGDGTISPVIVAWTPNVVALVVAVASSAQARRPRETA